MLLNTTMPGYRVRKIQAWLGHESLEVTLDYLGVDDAADESSQQQVNNNGSKLLSAHPCLAVTRMWLYEAGYK